MPGARDGRTAPFLTGTGYHTGLLLEHRQDRAPLYVCPRTGILRRASRAAKEKPYFGKAIRVNAGAEVRQIDGVRKLVELRQIGPRRVAR